MLTPVGLQVLDNNPQEVRRRLQVLSRVTTEESRCEASEEVQRAVALFDDEARP